jgi:hypothetical protein
LRPVKNKATLNPALIDTMPEVNTPVRWPNSSPSIAAQRCRKDTAEPAPTLPKPTILI